MYCTTILVSALVDAIVSGELSFFFFFFSLQTLRGVWVLVFAMGICFYDCVSMHWLIILTIGLNLLIRFKLI